MTDAVAASRSGSSTAPVLDEQEFVLFQRLMYREAGVTLPSSKKALVSGRLTKRLRACNCTSFTDYHRMLSHNGAERQLAIELLTTNETYFFREPKHFEFMRNVVLPARRSESFRVWSAACSSGEEVYSIAMVLADVLGSGDWSVLGSDINSQVIDKARAGHYGLARTEGIPRDLLRKYCLKGKGSQVGTLLIDKVLRERTEFRQINLNQPLPHLESLDVVFLRNVMIYFSPETKAQVVRRIASAIKPGGYLFIGHSESLNGISSDLALVKPSIYRRSL
jgi:chemotaxis protein methyltransferase CheR